MIIPVVPLGLFVSLFIVVSTTLSGSGFPKVLVIDCWTAKLPFRNSQYISGWDDSRFNMFTKYKVASVVLTIVSKYPWHYASY